MSFDIARKMAGGLALTLLLAGCGPDMNAVNRIALERKYTPLETEAFRICAKNFFRNRPIFTVPEGGLKMTDVPVEVCACHSKAITAVYLDEQIKSHGGFASSISKEKRKTLRINKKLIRSTFKPVDAANHLTSSLYNCAKDYQAANKDDELFELLPLKKKTEKTKKAAAATAPAG